jgi:glutamyl-tRNA reductase
MRLESIGLNHRTSSLEVRDRAALPPERLRAALHALMEQDNLEGVIILSTCNRTEFYLSPFQHTGEDELRRLLVELTGVAAEDAAAAYVMRDADCVTHLFRVAAGLDSQLLGEVQILGQLKDAYHVALEEGTTNSVLNKAFLRAIEAGKQVRMKTEISRGAVSMASASVTMAERVFGRLAGRRVLLVGAGRTSRLAAKYLASAGVDRWAVCNRTRANAEAVADLIGGRVAEFPPTVGDLAWADLIVSATSAGWPVITLDGMRQAKKQAAGVKLLLDLAVPRDSEPAIAELSDLYLYTVDDFEDLVAANLEARRGEAERAELLLKGLVAEFNEWYQEHRIVPAAQQIQDALEELRAREVERNARRFHETDREQVDRFSRSLIRKVAALFIANLKRASLEDDDLDMAMAVARAAAPEGENDLENVLQRLDNELSH